MGKVDVNKPVTNPELKELIRLRNSIPDSDSERVTDCMNRLLGELAENAHLLSVIDMPTDGLKHEENGGITIIEDTTISFEGITDINQNNFLVAYTDWESLRGNPQHQHDDVQTMILSFEDYYAMLNDSDSGLCINPYTDNFVLPKELLQRVSEVKSMRQIGFYKKVIQKDTHVLTGEPKDYPYAMTEAVSNAAKSDSRIKAIHLKLMISGDEKSYLFIVDFRGDRNEVFPLLVNAGKPYLPEGMFIDIVPLNEEPWKSIADNKPFYKRKGFLF